jgi:hypothetical protein
VSWRLVCEFEVPGAFEHHPKDHCRLIEYVSLSSGERSYRVQYVSPGAIEGEVMWRDIVETASIGRLVEAAYRAGWHREEKCPGEDLK